MYALPELRLSGAYLLRDFVDSFARLGYKLSDSMFFVIDKLRAPDIYA